MGRVSFILAIVSAVLGAPLLVFAADAIAPTVNETGAPPDATVAEPTTVVVEPPVGEPAPAPAPVTPVAPPPAVTAIAAVAPKPRPKRETHGLALASGFGITYGALGLQARYDVPITRSLTVSPFVAGGIAFGPLSGPFGVSAALGARHRAVLDLGVAPLDRLRLVLHGATAAEKIIFGPFAAVGYERMSERGWFWRGTLEVGYGTWSATSAPIDAHWFFFPGVGAGRRIW